MTVTQLRRRLVFLGGAALLTITGCLGLAVRANAAASPPSPRNEAPAQVSIVPALPAPPAGATRVGVVVVASEDSCAPERLTALAVDDCE